MRIVLCLLLSAVPMMAGEKFYPEAKSGKGELRYVDRIPVATLEGTPDEIGAQYGELILQHANKSLLPRVNAYMEKVGWKDSFPAMVKLSGLVFINFPREQQKELSAAAKVAGVDRNLLTTFNAIPDLAKMGGCSTLIAEPKRSATGHPLFGRNLDWPPFESLEEHTLVVVYKSEGKHTVAAITFPVLFGALSGMNDAGLSMATNEIYEANDKSAKRNLTGTPLMLLIRKCLEECTTVEEVEAKLKKSDRTTYYSLTVCDAKHGCVFEVTPKSVVRREAINDVTCCTNHFRTDALKMSTTCDRFPKLEAIQNASGKLGIEEIKKGLDQVNQGANTVQSMVFEPADRLLHLSYGGQGKSATTQPYIKLDLKPYFQK